MFLYFKIKLRKLVAPTHECPPPPLPRPVCLSVCVCELTDFCPYSSIVLLGSSVLLGVDSPYLI